MAKRFTCFTFEIAKIHIVMNYNLKVGHPPVEGRVTPYTTQFGIEFS